MAWEPRSENSHGLLNLNLEKISQLVTVEAITNSEGRQQSLLLQAIQG